jgi:hypothetical protein
VTTLGLVSSFMAVPVLALYVNSEQVVKLYARPTPLLLVWPLMLYWITRGWFFTHQRANASRSHRVRVQRLGQLRH